MPPRLPATVVRLRKRMDRLNARLVAALQARARLALRIARTKERAGLPAPDPARERAMLAAVLRAAPAGFARRDLARLVRAVFAASRRLVVGDRARRAR
jgi:chorismate mutase